MRPRKVILEVGSGWKQPRPGLRALLDAVEQNWCSRVAVERPDRLSRHEETLIVIELQALLAEAAFGTAEKPSTLVIAFAIQEKNGTLTTLKIAHVVSLNLRLMEQPRRSAKTSVTYYRRSAGTTADAPVIVDTAEIATDYDDQGTTVDTSPIELLNQRGIFSTAKGAYDQVMVDMLASSDQVAVPLGTPAVLPLTMETSVLPANPGIASNVSPASESGDASHDPFGRIYQTQGQASARLEFTPGAIPSSGHSVLVLEARFTKHNRGRAATTLQRNVNVSRKLVAKPLEPKPDVTVLQSG